MAERSQVMSAERVELRSGFYRDSVTLLQASEAIANSAGVEAALIAMATPLNLELYQRLAFDEAAIAAATPNDLLVAIRGADDAALERALALLEARFTAPATTATAGFGAPVPP